MIPSITACAFYTAHLCGQVTPRISIVGLELKWLLLSSRTGVSLRLRVDVDIGSVIKSFTKPSFIYDLHVKVIAINRLMYAPYSATN